MSKYTWRNLSTKSRIAMVAITIFGMLSLTACMGPSQSKVNDESEPNGAKAEKTTITVFAAASLNKAFVDIAEYMKPEHPEIEIKFSFEGSSTLVDQLKEGANADVFASADERNMTKAIEAGLVEKPILFASNTLVLITPKDNPGNVTGMDSSLDGKRLVVCAPEVPCGNATKILAEKMGLTLKPLSTELKVTDVRGKVESGEADAGLVYMTDASAAADKVKIFPIDQAKDVVNQYPIAVVKNTKNSAAAQIFIDEVLHESGQKILSSYGFAQPKLVS